MDLNLAKNVLKKVEKDYDAMAQEWNQSRPYPKPFQIRPVQKIKKDDRVLEIGCGNAVLYDFLAKKSINYVGLDISQRLLNLAKQRIKKQKIKGSRAKLIKGDLIDLPLADKKFDWVLAFAVLHHIPSKALQQQSAQEIFRVLKPEGRVVVTVWNLYTSYAKEKFKIAEQLKISKTGWDKKDLLTPWKATPKKVIERYLYRFDKQELFDLFKKVGFKNIKVGYGDPLGRWTKSLTKSYNIVLTAKRY